MSLLNYRNFKHLELDFSKKINYFTGDNGVGKTNLLDAIYYLSFCKSAINPIDSQIVYHGADCFMLKGKYKTDLGESLIISSSVRPKKRKRFKCGDKEYQRFSDHMGVIPLVMVSPADSSLIEGGSDERRRFLDMVISQHDREYLSLLIEYGRALTQRNTLLKQNNENEVDDELYLVWEEIMARSGSIIYNKRREFVESLKPRFRSVYSAIGAKRENVEFEYLSHVEEGSLLEQFKDFRMKERIMGYSLRGIHKDDLILTLDGYPIKKEGSQGQNKSCLVALKLSQYLYLSEMSTDKKPILLLDDLFDKLDALRVEQILNIVSDERFGQIFITDVNRTNLDNMLKGTGKEYKCFTVEYGKVI